VRLRGLILSAAVLTALAVAMAFANDVSGDYVRETAPEPGRAGPAVDALLDGHLDRFFDVQPLLGMVSLLWRLPFAALARAAGGDVTAEYQAGAAGCLLGPVALGAYLRARMGQLGRPGPACWLVAVLCVANPFTQNALRTGHPEEPLAAALAVGAVLAARRRPLLAGALAGLAAGTKQFALVVVPVVGATVVRRRLAAMAVALAVAAPFLLAGPIGDGDRAATVRADVLDSRIVNEVNLWWPVTNVTVALGPESLGTSYGLLPAGLTRGGVAPLVPVVAVVAAFIFWRRGRRWSEQAVGPALALLALVLLMRCALDPAQLWYYGIAPFLAICAWEGLAGPRAVPRVALGAAAGYAIVFGGLLTRVDESITSLAYVLVTVPIGVVLARAAFTDPEPSTC